MAKVYYEDNADLSVLSGKTVGIIGYGSQGHAHALSLKDSGLDVMVGLYEGSSSWAKAEEAGLRVSIVSEVAKQSDMIMMLVPDHLQSRIYNESIKPELQDGKTLMFAHGFSIHYELITPPEGVDVVMVAPKAPGHRVREVFTRDSGVPGLLAIHQDSSGIASDVGLAYAHGIGCTRAGVLTTTFKEETETDLFGEQTVLCGGASALIQTGYEVLIEAGYQPEMAYFECLHELKLIVDLMNEAGISGMRFSISETAKWGDVSVGPKIIDASVKKRMKTALKEIQNGKFAKGWVREYETGYKRYNKLLKDGEKHNIEKVGERLRGMMPWMKKRRVKGTQAAY